MPKKYRPDPLLNFFGMCISYCRIGYFSDHFFYLLLLFYIFFIVEAVPYEPSAAPVTPKPQYVRPTPKSYGGNSDYRLPKKQEFSNFPANAYEGEYNDFEDSGPPKEDVKRKIQHSFGSVSNLVTPSPTEIKKNNKERQPVNPLDK